MKTLIYLSGIFGGVLIVLWFVGIFYAPLDHIFLLLGGLGLTCLVCFPFYYIDKARERRKIDRIIKSHRQESGDIDLKMGEKSPVKGWSMNDSPYHERKSGLTWGGGNIHAANASRGTRRKFGK